MKRLFSLFASISALAIAAVTAFAVAAGSWLADLVPVDPIPLDRTPRSIFETRRLGLA